MILSWKIIELGAARPILVMAACLIILTAPYLQANQAIKINSGSTCLCSSHCCCKSLSETNGHCRIVESKQNCHCEMEQDQVPAKAPLDAQTPDSRPNDYQAADVEMVFESFPMPFERPARGSVPEETIAAIPIYLSVSSLLI